MEPFGIGVPSSTSFSIPLSREFHWNQLPHTHGLSCQGHLDQSKVHFCWSKRMGHKYRINTNESLLFCFWISLIRKRCHIESVEPQTVPSSTLLANPPLILRPDWRSNRRFWFPIVKIDIYDLLPFLFFVSCNMITSTPYFPKISLIELFLWLPTSL